MNQSIVFLACCAELIGTLPPLLWTLGELLFLLALLLIADESKHPLYLVLAAHNDSRLLIIPINNHIQYGYLPIGTHSAGILNQEGNGGTLV